MDKHIEPQAKRRSLDHYVIQVHDLEKAGSRYESLGFQVMPRMRHIEIGSANRVIQFGSTYLELIGELDNALPLVRANLADRFDCGEGLTMVSLNSSGLEADHRRVQDLSLDPAPIISARRKVTMPDGRVDETDSQCFYIWRPERRYLSLFLSQHHKPGMIWIPEYQRHPNTASETTGITYVSDDPAREREYFSQLLECAPECDEPGLIRFRGTRGEVFEIYSRSRLSERYGVNTPEICAKLPGYPVGIQITVQSLAKLQPILVGNGVKHTVMDEGLIVGPQESHGVVIEFTEIGR